MKAAGSSRSSDRFAIMCGSVRAASSSPAVAGGGTNAANSLTVVVTECQAEFITWFLTYASLKYTLESYQDYLQGIPVKDQACPSVSSATGVTLQSVQKAFPTLF